MIDHLIFDTTDFESMEDTHSVGAYVRSGRSGALITHHSSPEAGNVTFTFADADVTVGTNTIAETGHGLVTGDVVRLSNTGGALPTGLAAATDYWVIRVDDDNFQLAATAKDAEEGSPIDITAAAGGGTHTLTEQEQDRRALDVWVVNPIDVNITQADEITVFQGTDPWIIGDGGGSITVDAVQLDIDDLNATDDAVQAWAHDGTGNAITSTAGALDVNIANTEIAVIQGSDSPWAVEATNLDIRDLTHVSDSVRLGDGTSFISSGDGDSDDLANTFNAFDSRSFNYVYDSVGDNWDRLRGSGGSLFVSDVADTAIASASNTLGANNTAEDVVASPLASRKYLFLKNNDNKTAYIGATGVSAANGFPLAPGSILELRAGPSIDIEWVASSAGHDLRTLELS